MDVKQLVDTLGANSQTIAVALIGFFLITWFLRSSFVRRLKNAAEETVFSNWRLAVLATTGLVLTLAACWTTWDGLNNFTNEPLLSAMITFGIQGIMLIVAWLIGESFATGMSFVPGPTSVKRFAAATVAMSFLGLALVIGAVAIYASTRGISDDTLTIGLGSLGALILTLILLSAFSRNDVIAPYVQATRIIAKNSMLWLMFFACMAMSVFFSFDSRFNAVFPAAERVRVAELRAQNQVSGIIADIGQTIETQRAASAQALFETEGWKSYEAQIDGIAAAARESEGEIERYFNEQIEDRNRAVKEQQERMTSAQSGQAGLASRKISLTEEKGRLASERPSLAAEYAEKKADVDSKQKEADAKRVEALAEDKGVEGTGKQGRGPMYRERMNELALLQAAVKIAEERLKDSQKRFNGVESRLAAIDRELALIDGDLAKLKGEAQTAEQRITATQSQVSSAPGEIIDPSRMVPLLAKSKGDFRQQPLVEHLAEVQRVCGQIFSAMNSTEATKSRTKGLDCNPKQASEAAGAVFALNAGSAAFAANCVGGDKLTQHKSADALFGFAAKCLSDSGLPSKQTDELRTKIAYAEMTRDDRAHRFVVSLNAFNDGNNLAYLAMAIAIALDSLIFMSGLFGANVVRSPLSDVPGTKARSGDQLESTINAALGTHPYEAAWATLNALRPMTNSDGFSAMADLSTMERSAADRVRMVLTAGADIGAVEALSINPERYRVRSELREYLSTVCDKHIKSDATAKDRARLDQLVTAALAPHPREHAEIVLHTLEPIRETEGFTSMVTLSDIVDGYENRVVRRVMNAGSAVKAVAPDVKIDDRYYIRPALYETLLTVRATAPESANYIYERRRFGDVQNRPALDGGVLREARPELPRADRATAELPKPAPALPRIMPLTQDEKANLAAHYKQELLSAIGLNATVVDQRLQLTAARQAMLEAWKTLDAHSKKNELLEELLRKFQNEQDRQLSEVYTRLVSETAGDGRKRSVLDAVEDQVRDDLALYMLFPEINLIDYLIDEIERAAQFDDGLQHGEQMLRDQLKYAREGLGQLNLSNPRSWHEIRQRLAVGYQKDMPNFLNKFGPHKDDLRDENDI